MNYEPEGIRHIKIRKKVDNQNDGDDKDENDDSSYTSVSSTSSSVTSEESDYDNISSNDEIKHDKKEKKNYEKGKKNDDIKDTNDNDQDLNNVDTFPCIKNDSVKSKKTNKVNFDSLLKAVVEISDRIEDQERKLKEFEESGEKHKKKSLGKHERPKTAVLRYREESEYSSFDQQDSDDESALSTVSKTSSQKRRVQSGVDHCRFSDTASASRMNMSFSNDQVRHIDKENKRLLQRLLRTKMSKLQPDNKPKQQRVRVQSASAINRARRQQEIDQENLRLLHRLQSVKPTNGLERNSLLNEHTKEQFSGKTGKPRPSSAASSKRRPISASLRPASGRSSGKVLFDDTASEKSQSSRRSTRSKMNYERQQNWNDRW